MKLLTTLIASSLALATPAFACTPFNSASWESNLLQKALASDAYLAEVQKLGPGSQTSLETVRPTAGGFVVKLKNEESSTSCAIEISSKLAPPSEGASSCAEYVFSARTVCW